MPVPSECCGCGTRKRGWMGSRRIWWVSVWAGLVGCSGSAPLKGAQGPPVVALVTIDTWRLDHFRADLTPRIWTLAKGGERYTQAWSPIGLTSPAHATMLTGKQPWEHGMEANNHHGFRLPAEVPRVLDHPEFDGIAKGAFVSAWPAGPAGGLDRGFDVFDGPESGERPGKVTVDRALEWLPTDAPAFIWVHVYEPHGPYEGLGATDAERYAEEVRKADKLLTPLLDALEARGSLIVVAADHGEVLLEEKCGRQHERSVHDAVLRVAMVRHGPGIAPAVVDEMVGLEDVPDLLLGKPATPDAFRLAESGICEPGCSPGCTPIGVKGRDRVGIASDGARVHLRGGRVRTTGTPEKDLIDAVVAIPAVPDPRREDVDRESLEKLGYQEP